MICFILGLNNLIIGFFFLYLFRQEFSPFYKKEIFYSISLEHPNYQQFYSCVLEPLFSKT